VKPLGGNGTSCPSSHVQQQRITVSSSLNARAQPFLPSPRCEEVSRDSYTTAPLSISVCTHAPSPLNAKAPPFTPGLQGQTGIARPDELLALQESGSFASDRQELYGRNVTGSSLNANAMTFTPVEGNVGFMSVMMDY